MYEEKELFTLPGFINTFTELSYLTPLPTLQLKVPSFVQCNTAYKSLSREAAVSLYQAPSLSTASFSHPIYVATGGLKRGSSILYQVSSTPSLSTATQLPPKLCS